MADDYMTIFERKLHMILTEMPIRHFNTAGTIPDRDGVVRVDPMTGSRTSKFGRSYQGYTSPKYMKIVSDKLSRLSGYNINIFIIDMKLNKLNISYLPEENMSVTELSDLTGIAVNELDDAINFVMSGNNDQDEFSPWLYMHQLGEAIFNSCSGEDGEGCYLYFKKFFKQMYALDPKWYYRLKMGSARTAKAEGGFISDLTQELITEYLWHGGRIRYDYPEGMDKDIIDKTLNIFYSALKKLLDSYVGRVLFNDVGDV